jgi:hypothetical protein
MYQVGEVFERKDRQYKIVAHVAHETKETFVYLVAVREFGSAEVVYTTAEDGSFESYDKTDFWLG